MRSQVLKYLLIFVLLVSVALNLYLFRQGEAWEDAFYDQSSTTADIEFIFKRSGADTSYSHLLVTSKDLFKGNVEEVEAKEIHVNNGADEKAIRVHDSILLFKDGHYFGSEVHLPNH